MIPTILYILSTIGLTNILVHGSIFNIIQVQDKSLRDWAKDKMGESFRVFECYECTGFWAGMICGLIVFPSSWWYLPLYGFAGSVIAQTYIDIIDLLRSKISFVLGGDDEEQRD